MPIPRRPEVPGWNTVAQRAEAAAEGLLRAHGYVILDSRKVPEFELGPARETSTALQSVIDRSGSTVVVGIAILQCKLDAAVRQPVVPLAPKWPPERHDAQKRLPDRFLDRANVELEVWLLERGEKRPYIEGKQPSATATGHCDVERLAGDAAQSCMEDVLRRFLRLRAPIGLSAPQAATIRR